MTCCFCCLHVQRACEATIDKYGVGSCGPRGFYGTIDVHLHLEKHIAEFMQTEESIIYAYDLATVPSLLPAFANAKDLIICDEVRQVSGICVAVCRFGLECLVCIVSTGVGKCCVCPILQRNNAIHCMKSLTCLPVCCLHRLLQPDSMHLANV